MDTLYHVPPTPGRTVLRPSVTKYFGKPKQVCLTASLPMALMYGIKHFEYAYGYTNEVPVDAELPIPDVCEALLEQERLGALKIVRWDETSEKSRRWVVRAEADTIREKGLLTRPDDPFARYMQEKYPESWALAAEGLSGGMEHTSAEHEGGKP